MKLLLENWRQYLDEQKLHEVSIKKWGDWTVADLQQLIDMARSGESKQAQSLLGRLLGTEAIKVIPVVGQLLTGGEMIAAYYNKLKRKTQEQTHYPWFLIARYYCISFLLLGYQLSFLWRILFNLAIMNLLRLHLLFFVITFILNSFYS